MFFVAVFFWPFNKIWGILCFFTKDSCNTSVGVKNEVNLQIWLQTTNQSYTLLLKIESLETGSPLDLHLTDMKEKHNASTNLELGGSPSCRHLPMLTFFSCSPNLWIIPSHLTKLFAQGFSHVEHEGFLDGNLLARYLKMPEMKQQVGTWSLTKGRPSPSFDVFFFL